MTQSIIVQVGQCGNQVGRCFWELALREHARYNKAGVYNEPMGSFFRNVDSRGNNIPLGDGTGRITSLKARAVLVDMEEGVVSELLRSPLSEVFDHRQLITDVSGSGNNWAVGNKMYGVRYAEEVTQSLRRAAEQCDCLQSFFLIHSLGGGTGSGIGTKILDILQNEFPDVYRFVTAVFPSADDDVITSPYNCVLSLSELSESADCVLPIENQALLDICHKITRAAEIKKGALAVRIGSSLKERGGAGGVIKENQPFDAMNNIIANLLLNLTSASRFEGSLNVDLNEITMNLVPFPQLHFLIPAMTPLYGLQDVALPPRRLDQAFTDAFSRECQLIKADPRHGLYLACALMVRGKINVSDVRRNIERLRPSLQFIHWNQEGWKTGLCAVPPLHQSYSLLTLANNTCFRHTLDHIAQQFDRLYKRKAHLHHYTRVDGMSLDLFALSRERLASLRDEYHSLEKTARGPVPSLERLRIC